MGHELISTWLNLPAGPWPPDHYTLLGLPWGESDVARIERHVQERLERVRSFQLAHPEQATEAMNRLAQAFISLTDAASRRTYESSLVGRTPAASALGSTAVAVDSPPAPQMLDWREAPPPARAASAVGEAPAPAQETTSTLQDAATVEAPAVRPVPTGPADFDQLWQPLHKGLATRRALLDRIQLVRQLLHAWRAAGKYLRRSERPLSKPSEATDLLQLMERVRKLLGTLPGLLGEAGQPGYLVAALARQPLIVPTVQTLLPSQRAALARDWQQGLALLTAHLKWLRLEARALRERSGFTRGLRTVLITLRDRPGLILFVLGLVALNLLPVFRARLLEQLIVVLCVLAFRFFAWWDTRTTVRRVRSSAELPSARRRPERPLPR